MQTINCLLCQNKLIIPDDWISPNIYISCVSLDCMSYELLYKLSSDKEIIGVYYGILTYNKKYYIVYHKDFSSIHIRHETYDIHINLPLSSDLILFLTPDNFEQKIKTLLTYN